MSKYCSEKKIVSSNCGNSNEHSNVILDVYNCDLTMVVKDGYLRGEIMVENGLCSLWSGIRATYGVNHGRVAFQIKVFNMIVERNSIMKSNFRLFVFIVLLIYYQMKIHMEFALVGQPMTMDYILVLKNYFFIGKSRISSSGDELLSYAYENSGKIWTNKQSNRYGKRYSIGDTITCYAVN